MAPAAFWRAWSIWAVSVAVTATALGYTAVHPLPAKLANVAGSGLDGAVGIVFIGAFATVGALLAWKRPENPIGWLLSAIGLAFAVAVFGVFLAHFPRTLTLADWLGFLTAGLRAVRVRRAAVPHRASALPPLAAGGLGRRGRPGRVGPGQRVRSHDHHGQPAMPNPVGVTGPAGDIFKLMAFGGAVLIAAAGLAAVLSLAFRYRRARTAERAQLKWLVYAAAVIVVACSPRCRPRIPIASTNLQNAISSGAVALVPVAIGIAVLRYRLYDIDRVISRTVAYAIVTGLLVGIYAGLVLLATQVLGVHTPVAVAAATLAAAALFNPVRRRVQRAVDRRFNRARYDADQTVAAFAARLKDAVDLDAVRDDLAGVVHQALEPAHVSVWISQRD